MKSRILNLTLIIAIGLMSVISAFKGDYTDSLLCIIILQLNMYNTGKRGE